MSDESAIYQRWLATREMPSLDRRRRAIEAARAARPDATMMVVTLWTASVGPDGVYTRTWPLVCSEHDADERLRNALEIDCWLTPREAVESLVASLDMDLARLRRELAKAERNAANAKRLLEEVGDE